MALIADSGALYALYDRSDEHHLPVRETIAAEPGPIIVPAAILAEVDYLLRTRLGQAAESSFLQGIVKGAFTVAPFVVDDAVICRRLLEQYSDLDLGLADAAVIAAAERLQIHRILTVDERDFRAVRNSRGESFTLLPADRKRRR